MAPSTPTAVKSKPETAVALGVPLADRRALHPLLEWTGADCGFATGAILLGDIVDAGKVIDQVVVGCEGKDNFSISCHGNTLIVEKIMQLLKDRGATLVKSNRMLAEISQSKHSDNIIAAEAQTSQTLAVTLEGAKIILVKGQGYVLVEKEE